MGRKRQLGMRCGEVAEYLGCSRKAVQRMTRSGELPSTCAEGSYPRYDLRDVERLLVTLIWSKDTRI